MHRSITPLASAVLALTCFASAQAPGAFYLVGSGCNGQSGACVTLNGSGATITPHSLTNEYCYPVQAPSPMTVLGFNLFVQTVNGNHLRVATALYLENPANPGSPDLIPSATGFMNVSGNAAFYPTVLDKPIQIASNTTFWISADTRGVSPSNTNGSAAPGPIYWRGTAQGLGSWSPTGIVANPAYQIACALGGNSGSSPLHYVDKVPMIGQSMDLMLKGAPGNATAFLLVGSWDRNHDLSPLGAPGCVQIPYADVVLATTTSGTGDAAITETVPNNPALVGTHFYTQFVVVEPGANALNMVVSNGGLGSIGG